MKYFPIPYIQGITRDTMPRLIPEQRASDGNNVSFVNGQILLRPGLLSLPGVPLNGPIMGMAVYNQLDFDPILVVATHRDIYRYDENSGWHYITPVIITGTVNGNVINSKTVNFTDTPFDLGLLTKREVYQIGFGSTNPDNITTWYTVDEVVTNSQLLLMVNVSISGGSSYVMRVCFSGDDNDYFSFAVPYSFTEQDRVLVVSNSVDPLVEWNGAGMMTYAGGTMPTGKHISFFGSAGFEHMVVASPSIAGTVYYQSLYVSSADDYTDQTAYYDLLDTDDKIVGVKALRGRLMIYKESHITECIPSVNGDNIDPYDFIQNRHMVGTPSIRAVGEFDGFHIFFGWNDFYLLDGASTYRIGGEIVKSILREINEDAFESCFSVEIPETRQYCFFAPIGGGQKKPNAVFIYNYETKAWTIWRFPFDVMSAGMYYRGVYPTWETINSQEITWDYWNTPWEDLSNTDVIPTLLLGDTEGYVYEFDSQYKTDDGDIINARFTTRDYPLNDAKHEVKFNELVVGFTNKFSGSIRVRASVDFGDTWSEWRTLAFDGSGSYVERTAQFIMRGKQVRLQFENVNGSMFEIESLILGYNDSGIRKEK